MELKRLNKAISETGYCSRREADKLIEQGKVLVNGKRPELGTKVSRNDTITVNGQTITKEAPFVLIAFNKPVGVTCTTERHVQGNIIDYINYPDRIFPIGRLDKPSQGLILLTNDGDIVNKILRSKNNHDKEYVVTLNKPYAPDFLAKMQNGVPILDTITKKCEASPINESTFSIILTEGLNRQIRRMCSHFGYEVTKLERKRIMNVELGDLPQGEYRSLSEQELKTLLTNISHSIKTEEASK